MVSASACPFFIDSFFVVLFGASVAHAANSTHMTELVVQFMCWFCCAVTDRPVAAHSHTHDIAPLPSYIQLGNRNTGFWPRSPDLMHF